MATTLETYRVGGRLPRYSTKLSAFANGMYLTKQTIPEGYARVMVNYDIDDTGSNIKPRSGREKIQVIKEDSPKLGGVTMTDYLYAYNKEETEVDSIRDVVLSLGLYTKISDLLPRDDSINYKRPIYVANMEHIIDNNVYAFDEDQGYIVTTPGPIYTRQLNEFWALDYDKALERFNSVSTQDLGYVTARTLKHAYAFNKAFKNDIGKPISTIANNEVIAFAGPKIKYTEYTANPERNTLSNFDTPALAKLKLVAGDSGYVIKRSAIAPKRLNVLEAGALGYNMLSETPYQFIDEKTGALTIQGILYYKADDLAKPMFVPKLGEPMDIRVYYTYPAEGIQLKIKVETLDLADLNSKWVVLEDFTKEVKAGEAITYRYTPTKNDVTIRFTIREGDKTETEVPFSIPIVCGDSTYDRLEGTNFDLSTCKGMISWQGCIGVYGVDDALDTIFFSDVEDPSYFPFPNNILHFDNEITAVHNYLDFLLVITVDSIWLVTPGVGIINSVQKRVLTNIHIPEIDAINLVVLKDEIFFKTDTQFYVLKPNKYTSNATDLKNFVNSTAIANYTMDFQVETVRLLNEVYRNIWQTLTKSRREQIRFEDFDVLNTVSQVKDSEVHYIYTIRPKLTGGIETDLLNLHLVYNTITRSWRLYFIAIGDTDTDYEPILYRNKQSGDYYEFFPHNAEEGGSIVVTKRSNKVLTDNVTDGDWSLTKGYDNFTYIDTGNIALDDILTKRFREVQFNIMNLEHNLMKFFIDFRVDGVEQIQATHYEMQHITDPHDPEYGKIYVTPIEQANLGVNGITELANNITQAEYFALDMSKFPDLNVATVRFRLQGRGRRGAVQILNTSLKKYELSDITWIYRNMSAR